MYVHVVFASLLPLMSRYIVIEWVDAIKKNALVQVSNYSLANWYTSQKSARCIPSFMVKRMTRNKPFAGSRIYAHTTGLAQGIHLIG